MYGGEKPSRWDEWLDARFDGGKKKVPNPNSETRDDYPEVSFSTALKDDAFFQKALEEYKKWSADNPSEKDESSGQTGTSLAGSEGKKVGKFKVTESPAKEDEEAIKGIFGKKPPSVETLTGMFGSWVDSKDTATVRMFMDGDDFVFHMEVTGPPDEEGYEPRSEVIRSFKRTEKGIHVHHDLISLDSSLKGSGVGSSILKNSYKEYEKMGVKSVDQICAWDGRYVWARMGYEMDPGALKKNKSKLPKFMAEKMGMSGESVKKLEAWVEKNVKSGSDIADLTLPNGTKIGKDFLLSSESETYHAEMNIDPENPNYKRLKDYLSGKKDNKPKEVDLSEKKEEEEDVDSGWDDVPDAPEKKKEEDDVDSGWDDLSKSAYYRRKRNFR